MDAMDAWFVEVEDISDKGDLLSEEEYKKLIAE
jgi:hypothetical protein